MKNRVNNKEANEILKKYLSLKEAAAKSKAAEKAYKEYESFCVDKFDYLIHKKLNRYKQFANYEDLYQEARIALLSALKSYKPKCNNWFWWAGKYINTKISREANNHSTIKIPIKQAKTMRPYKVSEIPTIIDTDSPELNINNKVLNKAIRAAVSELPDEYRKVIELSGMEGLSISKISKNLNISRNNCMKLLSRAREDFKNNIIKYL